MERLGDTEARGPGIIDMKGGNVIIVQALKALAAQGTLKSMNVTVVMTGDEEDAGEPLGPRRGMRWSRRRRGRSMRSDSKMAPATRTRGHLSPRHHVVDAARQGQARALVADLSRRHGLRRDLRGRTHSQRLPREAGGQPYLTFNPGAIVGGTAADFDTVQARGTAFGKTSVIAEHVIVAGDMRTLSAEQLAKADNGDHRQGVAAARAGDDHVRRRLSAAGASDGNAAAGDVRQASRDVGAGPVAAVDPMRAGAADVAFIAGIVPNIMDGAGLMGHDDHTVGETADLTTLPSQTKRAAMLISATYTR